MTKLAKEIIKASNDKAMDITRTGTKKADSSISGNSSTPNAITIVLIVLKLLI